MDLRNTVAANNSANNVDPSALIEVERIRNIAESQIANSKAFFLLGAKALFDRQNEEKKELADNLAKFEKNYSLPQISEITKRIEAIAVQQQEFFDQAMEFRAKQTESKIVGQFYQSKTGPLLKQINDNLNEIVKIHSTEIERARTEAKEAAMGAEVRIPRGMMMLSGALIFIFLSMALLVISVISKRKAQFAERDRLYHEAKNAVQARDEVTAAISQDLNEPLENLNLLADQLLNSPNTNLEEAADFIRATTAQMDGLIRDICDQKTADLGGLTLRMDQLSIDEVLDEARLVLQPIAKQRDIRLQFDSVNPPVLAFFDKERVIRVLSNLVGNAIKFSPKHSKVVIKVRSDQQFVNISVMDSGPGISEIQKTDLFTNFWQARKTADQGAGVGLSIAKTIVEAHGGSVRVDSHAGPGSTFTFSLPRRRPVGAHIRKSVPSIRTAKKKNPGELREGPTHFL